jgi:Fe-S-cluster containining protein
VSREQARIHLQILGRERVVSSEVETDRARLEELLPLARAVSQTASELAEEDANARGRAVQCTKGCGACCRQVVPIAPVEAVQLARMVDAMEEPRRSLVLQRFERAVTAMKAAGVFEWDERYRTWALAAEPIDGEPRFERAGRAYFEVGVPCPFLEDESCSIHPVRPLVCREYQVTSDPVHCRSLSPELEALDRFAETTAALAELGAEIAPAEAPPRAIPLVLALEWSAAHGACLDEERDGRALFESFASRLAMLDE